MFKSVKKSILNPRPLRERVTRTCRVRGIDDKNTSAFKVILERERSELSRGSRNIMAISFDEANSVFSRFLIVIAGRVPAIWVQRVTNLVNTLAILSNGTNSTTSRLSSSSLSVILRRERSELSGESRNIMAISLNQMYHPGSSANELTLKAKDDESGCLLRCWKRWFSACCKFFKYPSLDANASTSPAGGEVLKSAVIFSVFMLFSAAAQATVCFLPDGNCGGLNYGYTDESGSTCTYKTREEAVRKKGDCETVQKQGFCFYLNCSMSKSDCDKAAANAPNHDKCCVPCGNCWKVADCSIPPIETCTGAGYETEQICKNNNQNFKPNGKFDKNGTACGECKDVPYITCPEMGDDYVTRAECTAKGSSFTFTSANVKDSDNNECGTCDSSVNCPSGYEPAATADCDTSKGFYRYTNSNYPDCIQCQCRNQGKINGYCTNCSAEGYVPRSSLPPGLDCNIQCPLDSSYVKADECTEIPCPTGYTKGLTSIHMCSYQNGQSATSIEYNGYSGAAPCGKCVYPQTCVGQGYKTCAECTDDQICELNGKSGSDGPCAKGCHNPTTAICSSVTSVSEKYVYLKKLIDGLAINNEAFRELSGYGDFDLYDTMQDAGLLQSDWTNMVVGDRTYIDDKQGNLLNIFLRKDDDGLPRVHIDIHLGKTYYTLFTHQNMPISDCIDIYKNLMKPLYCQVNRVGIYSTNFRVDKMTASYGEGACGGDKKCLETISDSSINAACRSCQSDNKQCYMPIIFGKSE